MRVFLVVSLFVFHAGSFVSFNRLFEDAQLHASCTSIGYSRVILIRVSILLLSGIACFSGRVFVHVSLWFVPRLNSASITTTGSGNKRRGASVFPEGQ